MNQEEFVSQTLCKVTVDLGSWDDGTPKRSTRVARWVQDRYVTAAGVWVDAAGERIEGVIRVDGAPELMELAEFLLLEEECGAENAAEVG